MRFRLVRYFTLTSLVFFVLVTGTLGYIYRKVSIENLMLLQQAGNENVSVTFVNSLWSRFLPFIYSVGDKSLAELKDYAVNDTIRSDIDVLFSRAKGLMQGTNAIKVKVYDLRGRTVFSTEKAQIGDDKSTNPGYLSAKGGVTFSAIDHKDKFSAFEQVIENRDVLFSYVPIRNPVTREIEGVLEVYSDITSFLAHINQTVYTVVGSVIGLLLFLFGALFMIVRRADAILRSQADERERDHQRVVQSEKMASLGQMVAGVAHQLNTPLGSARSNISLVIEMLASLSTPLKVGLHAVESLRKGERSVRLDPPVARSVLSYDDPGVDAEQLQQMLSDTMSSVDQMKELVVNLRDFTRIDRAKVADYDVNKGIDNVVYIAKSVLPTNIRVERQYEDLPRVQCMASQINQVFLNLITNAAQAIEGAGTITLTTTTAGDKVKIQVTDTGKGIPADVLPHIFDAYYTTKKAGEGTGLGLSIARDIVTGHGGTISVDSSEGLGTRFTVMLPIMESIPEPIQKAA
jgi:two-component system NtrC family sensor kinase